MDGPPHDQDPFIEPGISYRGAFVGVHRLALEHTGRLRFCEPVRKDVCRIAGGPDLIYDEQGYVVAMRFNRPGRGGNPAEEINFLPSTPPRRVPSCCPVQNTDGSCPWPTREQLITDATTGIGKPSSTGVACLRWLGMSEAAYLDSDPGQADVRYVDDPEFGRLKIYTFDDIEFEFEQVASNSILGAITIK